MYRNLKAFALANVFALVLFMSLSAGLLAVQPVPDTASEIETDSSPTVSDAFEQGEYRKAMDLIEKELAGGGISESRKAELSSRLLFIQTTLAIQDDKPKEALKIIQSALEDPNVINKEVFWRLQGQLQAAQKDYDAAKESFTRALQLDPDEKAVYFDLGEIAFTQKDWLNASVAYSQFIASRREVRDAQLKLVYCKIALDEIGHAKRLLNEFDVFDEKHPGYYFAKSAIARAQGNQEEAKNLLDQVQTIYGITTLYRYQGDYYAISQSSEKQSNAQKPGSMNEENKPENTAKPPTVSNPQAPANRT